MRSLYTQNYVCMTYIKNAFCLHLPISLPYSLSLVFLRNYFEFQVSLSGYSFPFTCWDCGSTVSGTGSEEAGTAVLGTETDELSPSLVDSSPDKSC